MKYELITVGKYAKRVGLSRHTIYQRIKNGKIDAKKVGGYLMIKVEKK